MRDKTFSGVVGIPIKSFGAGHAIKIRSMRAYPYPDDGICIVPDPGEINGTVLVLAASVGAEPITIGSAILIAPGIALTAQHCMKEIIEMTPPGAAPVATCTGFDGAALAIWQVDYSASVAATDLAILGLSLTTPHRNGDAIHAAQIDAKLPKVGDRVMAVGFRMVADQLGEKIDRFTGALIASCGKVAAVYRERRDSVMANFPCFEADLSTVGMMSGGPVFNEAGHLVGVVATSFEGDGLPTPTFVSAVWPALGSPFRTQWPRGLYRSTRSLHALHGAGLLIQNRNLIRVTEQADGTTTTIYMGP